MSIILPNLNHSFISPVPVPVPVPDSGSGPRFPGFPYALHKKVKKSHVSHLYVHVYITALHLRTITDIWYFQTLSHFRLFKINIDKYSYDSQPTPCIFCCLL